MNLTPAIETYHLRKEFNGKTAVADLSLVVERGEVFGFLGPNGAGKTTSIKMLLGLISPTAGGGTVLGSPLGDDQIRARVGFLPEHFRFHDWLTAEEFLNLHGDLYQMPGYKLRSRIPELLELVNLTSHANRKRRTFSKGMLQRVGLAQALLNEPDLILLDEPTSGLDPVGRRLVRDIIHTVRERGSTVFLNSHFLSEVEITCDRVAFLKEGIVIRISTLSSLVEGEFSLEIKAQNISTEVVDGLATWGPATWIDSDTITLTLEDEVHLPEINRYLVQHGVDVFGFSPKKVSLEDLFLKVVGEGGEA